MSIPPAGSLVIAVGNADCADDGVGPRVAALLARRLEQGARLILHSGEPLDLIDQWQGARKVVLIDAAAPFSEPAAVHRVDALRSALPAAPARTSTHGMGIAEAIALARALDRLPDQLLVYAIEGRCFEPGAPMTASVAAAVRRVADLVCEELSWQPCPRAAQPRGESSERGSGASTPIGNSRCSGGGLTPE